MKRIPVDWYGTIPTRSVPVGTGTGSTYGTMPTYLLLQATAMHSKEQPVSFMSHKLYGTLPIQIKKVPSL